LRWLSQSRISPKSPGGAAGAGGLALAGPAKASHTAKPPDTMNPRLFTLIFRLLFCLPAF
jgi:hypothetical protein